MRRIFILLVACVAQLPSALIHEASAQSRIGGGGMATIGGATRVPLAVSRAQTLRSQGKSATEAAATIRSELGTPPAELASAFQKVGYTADETATGLRNSYNAERMAVATALVIARYGLPAVVKAVRLIGGGGTAEAVDLVHTLRDGAFELGDIVKAVSQEYSLEATAATQMMRAAAMPYDVVAEILATKFGLPAEAAGAALYRAGFPAKEVAMGMVSSFNATPEQVVSAILGAGAPAQAVAQTLKQTLNRTDEQVLALLSARISNVAAVVQAMKAGAGTSAADLAKLMRARGALAKDIAKPLATAYGMAHDATLDALDAAGYNTQQRIEAAHRGLSQGIDYAAYYLHRQKVSAAGSIVIIGQEFAASADQAAGALMRAGYKVDEIALGLKEALNYTALQTATLLKDLRYGPVDIGAALGKVFQLGVVEIAQLLASIGL